MTAPTLQNVRDGIDSVLERGQGYRAHVGATKQGTSLLHDDPEQPLPLAEMIPMSTDAHVRMWWAMNTQSEPMDMLFYCHRTQGEDGTPAPVGFDFASRHNRDPSPDGSQDSDPSDDNDNHDNMSVCNQPELSAAAARRAPNRSTAQGTQAVHRSIRRMLTNRNQTLMLFPMPASHHLLVSKLLPFLVTWTLVP